MRERIAREADVMAIGKEKELRIIELRAKGHSFATIATEADVAKQTAVDVCRKYRERVEALEALEIEELYEKEKISTTERVKAFSDLLRRLREEIEKRDLSDVSTDKLIDFYFKQLSALGDFLKKPKFKSEGEVRGAELERGYTDSLIEFENPTAQGVVPE